MLRHEILTNFIHFQETKRFEFQPGANIFIGPNNSGKTSVFEGARRCLSVSQNTSVSSSHVPDKHSAVTCIFDIDNNHKLFSSMVRLPTDDAAADNQTVYLKAAYETAGKSFGIDLVKETKDKTLANESVEVEDSSKITESFENFLRYDKSPDEEQLPDLLEELRRIASANVEQFKHSTEQTDVLDTACERILREHVDATTVFTFAVRGIGPCQWSRSHKVTNDYKVQNYKTAQERSEILQWYLENVENQSITRKEKERVDEYFNIITNNSDFEFVIDYTNGSKELVALNKRNWKRRAGEDQCKPCSIMKVPEGITEAMNCAILLGVRDFKTVCLEEPEKGMHPQMIERIRELVLRKIEDRTILITSHHPSFLGPWTIPKLHIFKRIENRNGISFEAYSGSAIEQGYIDKKTPRIITSDHFASIFYAERILFVEGEADYLFMSALKQLFLSHDDIAVQLIKSGPEHLGRFRAFLCSLHIISLSGETHKLRFSKLCDAINTEKYFILDYDAIEDEKKSVKTFLENFNLTHNPENVMKDVRILEQDGLFVWKTRETGGKGKTGTIEDVLIALVETHGGLKDFFETNNVTLMYNKANKVQNRNKLFRHKDITDVNITNVVEKVMQCCVKDKAKYHSTELLRLVNFLYEMSQESHRKSFSE